MLWKERFSSSGTGGGSGKGEAKAAAGGGGGGGSGGGGEAEAAGGGWGAAGRKEQSTMEMAVAMAGNKGQMPVVEVVEVKRSAARRRCLRPRHRLHPAASSLHLLAAASLSMLCRPRCILATPCSDPTELPRRCATRARYSCSPAVP